MPDIYSESSDLDDDNKNNVSLNLFDLKLFE